LVGRPAPYCSRGYVRKELVSGIDHGWDRSLTTRKSAWAVGVKTYGYDAAGDVTSIVYKNYLGTGHPCQLKGTGTFSVLAYFQNKRACPLHKARMPSWRSEQAAA
jgi:hypothetical protein